MRRPNYIWPQLSQNYSGRNDSCSNRFDSRRPLKWYKDHFMKIHISLAVCHQIWPIPNIVSRAILETDGQNKRPIPPELTRDIRLMFQSIRLQETFEMVQRSFYEDTYQLSCLSSNMTNSQHRFASNTRNRWTKQKADSTGADERYPINEPKSNLVVSIS